MNMAVIMMGRGIASPPAVSTRPHGHGHVDTHAAHADAIGGCPRERRVTMMGGSSTRSSSGKQGCC